MIGFVLFSAIYCCRQRVISPRTGGYLYLRYISTSLQSSFAKALGDRNDCIIQRTACQKAGAQRPVFLLALPRMLASCLRVGAIPVKLRRGQGPRSTRPPTTAAGRQQQRQLKSPGWGTRVSRPNRAPLGPVGHSGCKVGESIEKAAPSRRKPRSVCCFAALLSPFPSSTPATRTDTHRRGHSLPSLRAFI